MKNVHEELEDMELVGPIGRLCERVHREKHTAQLRAVISRIERLDRSLRAAVSQVASYRQRLYVSVMLTFLN